MTNHAKRIIAREFLILIGAVIIGVLIFAGCFIYNKSVQSSIAKKTKQIESKEAQQAALNINTKESIPKFASRIRSKYPEYNEVGDTLLVNKLLEKYPEYKEAVDLTKIDGRSTKADSLYTSLSGEISTLKMQVADKSATIVTVEEKAWISIKWFLIALLVLFGVRYIYYGVSWSIKTLTVKNTA